MLQKWEWWLHNTVLNVTKSVQVNQVVMAHA